MFGRSIELKGRLNLGLAATDIRIERPVYRGEPLRSSRVIVEITPSLVAVRQAERGVMVRAHEVPMGRSEWGSDWTVFGPQIVASLNDAVRVTGVHGRRVVVVYDLGGVSCAVTSTTGEVPTARALDSACLAAQHARESVNERMVSAAVLLNGTSSLVGAKRSYLGCAEENATLARLAELVEQAGLRVEGMVPRDACAIVECVANLDVGDLRPSLSAWIGRHAMSIAIAHGGVLRTARVTGIGLCAIVDAIVNPGRSASSGGDRSVPTRAEAWNGLWTIGVPSATPEGVASSESDPRALLPIMQPVLQRMAVEIKQSLRFEVGVGDREEACLVVCGPGACCPGLREALCRFVGLDARKGVGRGSSREAGECGAMLHAGLELPFLLPAMQVERRVRRRVRGGLALGSVAALAMAVHVRVDATTRASEDQEQLALLSTALEPARQAGRAQRQAREEHALVGQARSRLREGVGDGTSASGVLRVLARAEATGVRMRSVDLLDRPDGKPQLAITAVVAIDAKSDPAVAIRAFLSMLEQSPLVSSARLGPTQRVALEGRDVQSFNVTAELLALPAEQRVSIVGGAR
jgi:hypothetical protein